MIYSNNVEPLPGLADSFEVVLIDNDKIQEEERMATIEKKSPEQAYLFKLK